MAVSADLSKYLDKAYDSSSLDEITALAAGGLLRRATAVHPTDDADARETT